MKWFNYNGDTFDRATKHLCFKYLGKSFTVTTDNGFTYKAKYCLVGPELFRFIARDGNRIVDDNKLIIKAVLQRKAK